MYKVKFIEDNVLYNASLQRIRGTQTLDVGSLVECRFKDCKWYDAEIVGLPGEFIMI